MKTLNFENVKDLFEKFVLSNEKMINVRGGDGEPTMPPTEPPVKI